MVALFSNFDSTEQQSQVNHSAAFENVIPERVQPKFYFVVLHLRNKPFSCFICRTLNLDNVAVGNDRFRFPSSSLNSCSMS